MAMTNLQAGIESKGNSHSTSAPQALSCAIITTAASVGTWTGSRGAFSRHKRGQKKPSARMHKRVIVLASFKSGSRRR